MAFLFLFQECISVISRYFNIFEGNFMGSNTFAKYGKEVASAKSSKLCMSIKQRELNVILLYISQ